MRRLALSSFTLLIAIAFCAYFFGRNAIAAPKKKTPSVDATPEKPAEKPDDKVPTAAAASGSTTTDADGGTAPATTSSSSSDSDAKEKDDEPADDTLNAYEGIGACDALVEKNVHDMRIWEKTQPPTPYKYPERETFLDAPWTPLFNGVSYSGALVAATLIPNLSAVLRGPNPAAGVSWPWSIPVGPAFWCTRKKGSFDVIKYRPIRLLLEPGFFAENPVAFWVRPGARFMWHPTSWFFGVGGGIGSLIEMTGNEPFRASISPEIVVALGRCCNPGYFSLALRHEFFFAGQTQITSASVGFTYF
jgi:hypothetical protein